MGDIGSFVEAVFCLALMVLGALAAWKFWHGRWLRLIAGNTFATEEEMESPCQRALGRRAAVLMLCCCAALAILMAPPLVEAATGEAAPGLASLLPMAAAALILVPCVYLVVWSNREAFKERKALVEADPSRAADAKLDRRAGIVLLCMLGGYLFIVLVVAPLAAG